MTASQPRKATPRPIRFLFENSLFLIGGTLIALIWANADPTTRNEDGRPTHTGSYDHFVHFNLAGLFRDQSAAHGAPAHAESPGHATAVEEHGGEHAEAHGGGHGFTIHFLINDVLMALFFAIAGKEVWESLLPGGALSNPRKAMTPLLATAGGVLGPASLYAGGVLMLGQWDTLGRGWAVPCATDIAFSYLFARLIFGAGHPAIAFLLLLAIADEAAGLMILAVFY
ncbi:MAG: Na+/H+ antiporter NhaA, partial [Planctomycetes bacterium]|nr:Na+/H+ antiporter NhaA [Planctomycetota bacterium]